jgi:cob(I)alamin adenosyltransferase
MKIYTRNGDKGETGLLYGGKFPRILRFPEASGTVDEAQAVLGLAGPNVKKTAIWKTRLSILKGIFTY